MSDSNVEDLSEAVDTGAAASKLEELRRRFLGDWLAALDDFNAVQEQLSAGTSSGAVDAAAASRVRATAAARLVESWHGLLDAAYREAHRLGRDSWGPGTAKAGALSPAAEKVLRREKQFAFRFAMDVAKGPEKEGRRSFPAGRRSAMYGQAVEGAFHRGAVDGAPPGQLIWWRLGDARHCVDCPILASNSPYTSETLPTVPRAGSTECVWTEDSLVRTRRGDVSIRDVCVGDEVWTHRSRWRRVEVVRRRPAGARRGVLLGTLGLTEEHRAWTADGWLRAGDIVRDGARLLHTQDAERLREVLGADALGSPYEDLPDVCQLLRLREAEGPARRLLQKLRDGAEGPETVGEPGSQGEDNRRHLEGWEGAEDSPPGEPDGAGLLQPPRGRAPLRGLLGRGPGADDLPLPVAVGGGERADPGGDGASPPERGPDGRPAGEPGAADSRGAWPGAHDGGEEGRAASGPRTGADREADLGLRGLRDGLRAVQARGEGAEVLLRELPEGALLFDLTVEEDHSFLIDGVFVENCWTSCTCRLEFGLAPGVTRGAPPPEPTPEEAANDLERGRPVEDRIEGPKPTPPPGSRLPTDAEDRQIQDLRHRMAFANRRADRASARGDLAERDRWLRIRSDLNGKLIDFEGSRGIWAPPTFSDKEILTSADLRAGDVSWLTHLRGIDGTTVHRAQASAVEAAAKAARESLGDLLDNLPPGGGPAVPDFDELLRRAGAPSSTFTGTFDSAAWDDPRALSEAAEVADPADHVVLSAVGLGAAGTLSAVPALLEECRERPYRVAFGPFGDGWEEAALRFGVWLDGEGEDVRALVAAASRRLGGRGLEVCPWQP